MSVTDRLVRRLVIADTIAELMHANLLEVFNQRDHELRRAAFAHTYADDIRWTEDDGITIGHEAFERQSHRAPSETR